MYFTSLLKKPAISIRKIHICMANTFLNSSLKVLEVPNNTGP